MNVKQQIPLRGHDRAGPMYWVINLKVYFGPEAKGLGNWKPRSFGKYHPKIFAFVAIYFQHKNFVRCEDIFHGRLLTLERRTGVSAVKRCEIAISLDGRSDTKLKGFVNVEMVHCQLK